MKIPELFQNKKPVFPWRYSLKEEANIDTIYDPGRETVGVQA